MGSLLRRRSRQSFGMGLLLSLCLLGLIPGRYGRADNLPSPVPGTHLADKPVYVLTSARTWSGAEQFCYDLQVLKRATLVGETTGGSAHAGVFHRIDDHFGVGIPETAVINPFSNVDWEGVGVAPESEGQSCGRT